MSIVTYWLVLLAVQRAPVGYVAALRESSVVLAAFVGTRYLSESGARRRTDRRHRGRRRPRAAGGLALSDDEFHPPAAVWMLARDEPRPRGGR